MITIVTKVIIAIAIIETQGGNKLNRTMKRDASHVMLSKPPKVLVDQSDNESTPCKIYELRKNRGKPIIHKRS